MLLCFSISSMRKLIFVYTILFSVAGFAQKKRANIWYFGKNAGLDFTSSVPVALLNSAMNTLEGTTSMCDTSGNLLFYTNGVNVWDRSHAMMPNGTGLTGDPSTAQTLAIPKPGSQTSFYIFYADDYGGPNGLRYSEVDMQLNGGLGDVVNNTKNTLLHLNASEKIAAVDHCNGEGVWVMTINYATDEFFAYLVTQTGIMPPVKSNCKPDVGYCCNSMKFSPDGKWLGYTNNTPAGGDDSQVFRFNDQTGLTQFKCTLPKDVSIGERLCGISFSPGSSKLYISSMYNYNIAGVYVTLCQYDLSAANIPGSKTEVLKQVFPGSGVSKYPMGEMQNAPDGKLYMARWGSWTDLDTISVIKSPDSAGLACQAVLSGIPLSGRSSLIGLPNFNESYFRNTPKAVPPCLEIIDDVEDLENGFRNVYAYPNPASDDFYFRSGGTGELMIYDVVGTLQYSISITDRVQTIHVANLPGGIYFWSFKTKQASYKGRIIISRQL